MELLVPRQSSRPKKSKQQAKPGHVQRKAKVALRYVEIELRPGVHRKDKAPIKLTMVHVQETSEPKDDDPENCGIKPDQIIRPMRQEDQRADLWTTFNVAQEHIIRGGMRGWRTNANGRPARATTREVKGIDQNVALNRGLWVLAAEMQKLAA